MLLLLQKLSNMINPKWGMNTERVRIMSYSQNYKSLLGFNISFKSVNQNDLISEKIIKGI